MRDSVDTVGSERYGIAKIGLWVLLLLSNFFVVILL